MGHLAPRSVTCTADLPHGPHHRRRRRRQHPCAGPPSANRAADLDPFTVVPATVAYREAATARQPVHWIERQRRGPTASALEVMTALVNELLPHIDLEQAGEPCQAQEELRHA